MTELMSTPANPSAAASRDHNPLKVSVVIPCYHSEKTIGTVVEMTREVLTDLGYDYEFVLVNDGSGDPTFSRIRELCTEDPRILGIDLARNFGQHNAIMAGLNQASGELILLMDDDMQTHPSQIPFLLDKIYEGWDVVFGRYDNGIQEAWYRRLGSSFAKWTTHTFAKLPKDIYASSFLVMRDYVKDQMIAYTGPYPFIDGLIFRTTNKVCDTPIKHFEREVGSSGYTLRSLVRLWSSILGLSILPLRMAAVVGVLTSLIGLIWALVVVIERLCGVVTADGWSSIMATLLIVSGIILVFLGLIGEYLGRLSLSVARHPQYEVRSEINVPGGIDQDHRFVRPVPRTNPAKDTTVDTAAATNTVSSVAKTTASTTSDTAR